MEERVEVMTDVQWRGMIQMILGIIERCPNHEEAIKAVRDLLDDSYKKSAYTDNKPTERD